MLLTEHNSDRRDDTNTRDTGSGHDALERVLATWRVRERMEHEAAHLFLDHAWQLGQLNLPSFLVEMTTSAAADEVRHARMCREIIEDVSLKMSNPVTAPLCVRTVVELGCHGLTATQQALYTSVAMCCVTETLSVALLLEMRSRTRHPVVSRTVHHIVKDEIRHSRIGWGHLALEASKEDVGWLAKHVPNMLRAAMWSDVRPMLAPQSTDVDLGGFGILAPSLGQTIFSDTVQKVILPGLARYGVSVVLPEAMVSPS